MSTQELYKQKFQAQLDEWKADIGKLKARAEIETADAQIAMHKQVETLEHGIDEAQKKLVELGAASEEAWESVKAGVESAWVSLKTTFSETKDKFKS